MNLYNQIKYNGYRINIYYDDDARSPREAYDNLGTLYTAHRRYRPEKEFDDHFDIDKVFEGHIGNFRESFLKSFSREASFCLRAFKRASRCSKPSS